MVSRLPGLLALALLPAAPGAAQDLAARTAALAAVATVDAAMVGDDGASSPEYRVFVAWRDAARTEDLVAATDHPSAVVRCYAARALAAADAGVDVLPILRARAADDAEVTTRSGCVTAREHAGDVVFSALWPLLGAEHRLDVAEHLVRTKSPLYARDQALRTLRFRDGMLHTIRGLARQGDACAAVALARWQLSADLPILEQHLGRPDPFDGNARFLAAAAFPDARLLPALAALLPAARARLASDNAYRLRFWLQAIAAQRSDGAAALLAEVLATAAPAGSPRARDLRDTVREVLAAHGDCTAFAALRAGLATARTR